VGGAPGRRRHRVADLKAELLARWVSGVPTERLDTVMRSPLRGVLLWQIFRTMARRVDPAQAANVDAAVEFRIRRSDGGGPDRVQVVIADGRCTTSRRGGRIPTVTLDMGPASFLRLVGGADSALRLVLRGKLRVGGDPFLAARLPKLLNIPGRPANGG